MWTGDPNLSRLYDVGDVIAGDFCVQRVMEGGLGVVYAVEHRGGDRLVLKTPKRRLDIGARQSFLTEAETWVRLGDHPNIVRALRVDELAGQLFVAAELVEPDVLGRVSLRDFLRRGVLRPNMVGAWSADFCFGLEHAHSRGMIAHRDVKPENLLIGVSGVLRITDFGIANLVTGAVQAVAGTPPYMAPEQWRNEPQDIRTDIYAFGIVMYEMCYGHLPFSGSGIEQLRYQHLQIEPRIPIGVFAEVIACCLSKDPEKRYRTPTALLAQVSRVCAANQLALPAKPTARGQRSLELHARAHALSALGKRAEAISAIRELVHEEPDRAENWTQLGRLLLEGDDNPGALVALEKSLSLDPTRSAAWNNLAMALKGQGKWQEAVVALDHALDCDPDNTGAMLNYSELLQCLGQSGQAILHLKRALELAPDKFSIWNNLGALYTNIGDKQNALNCLQNARAMAPHRYHQKIEEAITVAQRLSDQLSGAALTFSNPIVARQRLHEEALQNPNNKNGWHNLGLSHIQVKEYVDARECFVKVHALDQNDGFAVCRLIELSALLGDLAAVERWCSILATMPDGQKAAIAFKARALARCDRYQEAKRLILDATRKYPNDLEILIACGDVMMPHPGSETAMSNAVGVYQRAVRILKHSGDIKRQREIEGRLQHALEALLVCRRHDRG